MGIKSIKVINLLSFDEFIINEFTDINCIIGKNNVGKSNLLKLIRYFYEKLDDKKIVPPALNSNYSSFGSITVTYDTSRIKSIVTSTKNNSKFLKHIYNVLFKNEPKGIYKVFHVGEIKKDSSYELTLKVNSDDSTEWSEKNKDVRNILNFLYPFFEIETRHIDLYDWEKLWFIISKLKTFNVDKLKHEEVISFFDSSISEDSKSYSDYISKISNVIDISKYSYREKVLNYIKVGLKGHTFMVSGEALSIQSDGTNSYKYIELLLVLLITLTRREYITPAIYIDEPETGLHPKRNEELITKLFDVYVSFKKTKEEREIGRYKTPYPKILFSTHSPNILKSVIKLFGKDQQVFHFSIKNNTTSVKKMNSQYNDRRFLNVFSDNEARLFFSNFILFVEGATELELFSNLKLINHFKVLKKIDVYQNNEVTLKYTNPSYSNLSIPYLILYDADKFISYNINKEEIKFTNESIDVDEMYGKVNKSYYGSEQYCQKEAIEILIKNSDKAYKHDDKKIKFESLDLNHNIHSINKAVLNPNNIMLAATTIEGCLININSLNVFKMWLEYEIINNFCVRGNEDVNRLISRVKRNYKVHEIDRVFNSLFVMGGGDVNLSNSQKRFIKIVKYKYLKNIDKKLNYNCPNIKDLLILFRLVFDGKTDTLISIKNKTFKKHVDRSFVATVIEAKDKYFLPFKPVMGKTGGWVTLFLDFSIDYVASNCRKDEFDIKFEELFPEIYVIIKIASSSIE